MDQMEIRVEARPDAREPDVRLAAATPLEDFVKDTVGVSARVNVLDPEGIERAAGKARRIIDQDQGSRFR